MATIKKSSANLSALDDIFGKGSTPGQVSETESQVIGKKRAALDTLDNIFADNKPFAKAWEPPKEPSAFQKFVNKAGEVVNNVKETGKSGVNNLFEKSKTAKKVVDYVKGGIEISNDPLGNTKTGINIFKKVKQGESVKPELNRVLQGAVGTVADKLINLGTPGKAPSNPVEPLTKLNGPAQEEIKKALNSETGRKVVSTIDDKTSNLGLKVKSSIASVANYLGNSNVPLKDKAVFLANKAARKSVPLYDYFDKATVKALFKKDIIGQSEDKIREAYKQDFEKMLQKRNDPANNVFEKFMYELQDAGPQTLIGVGLGMVPYAGPVLAPSFYTALSANEQLEERGKVDSLLNIGIDTAGDVVLGRLFKGFVQTPTSLLKRTLEGFVTEGGTEVGQTILKLTNDYRNARTEEERRSVYAKFKDYIQSGAIAMEFGLGGIIGGGISAMGASSNAISKPAQVTPGLTPTAPVTTPIKETPLAQPQESSRAAAPLVTDVAEKMSSLDNLFENTAPVETPALIQEPVRPVNNRNTVIPENLIAKNPAKSDVYLEKTDDGYLYQENSLKRLVKLLKGNNSQVTDQIAYQRASIVLQKANEAFKQGQNAVQITEVGGRALESPIRLVKAEMKGKLPEDLKGVTVKEKITKIEPEDFRYISWTDELNEQYENFKKTLGKYPNPKFRERLTSGDAQTFRRILKEYGMRPASLDNMFYSQDKTDNEVFDMFLDRFNKRNDPVANIDKQLNDYFNQLAAEAKISEEDKNDIIKDIEENLTVEDVWGSIEKIDDKKLDSTIAKVEEEIKQYEQTDRGQIEEAEGKATVSQKTEEPKKLTQKDKVVEAVKGGEKSAKEVAEETGILVPNVRRILGMGAKEGTFERVAEGVYRLKKDGKDIAVIHAADAVETLPKLADEGFKADMVFLDIPYDLPSVKGGNRGIKYETISIAQFETIVDAISQIARTEDTPIIHMFSQADSSIAKMSKYNQVLFDYGFKPVAKGQWQKTFKDGSPVTNVRGQVAKPEGIIIFSRSGKINKADIPNLSFTLVRPKGYQTEKPAEMLKAIIEGTTEEGDIVLDPFAGSGVTLAEALKSGRKAVGIEKNEKVVEEVIKPRVEAAARMKTNPLAKKVQESELVGKTFFQNTVMTDSRLRSVNVSDEILITKVEDNKVHFKSVDGNSTGFMSQASFDKGIESGEIVENGKTPKASAKPAEAPKAVVKEEDKGYVKKPLTPEKVPYHNTFDVAFEMSLRQHYERTKRSVDRIADDLKKAGELKKQIDTFPRRSIDRTPEQRDIAYRYNSLTDKRNKDFYDFWTGESVQNPGMTRLEGLKNPTENKKASFRNEYINEVKKLISQGYAIPEEIIRQYPEFTKAVNSRARYEKGWKTSFANKSTAVDNSTKQDYGFKVKNQDGTPISEENIRRITMAAHEFENIAGPVKDIINFHDLTVAHTKGKFPFLTSDASGLYHSDEKTITVGVMGIKAFAHEMAHAIDYFSGTAGESIDKYHGTTGTYNPELMTKARMMMNGSFWEIERAMKTTGNLTEQQKENSRLLKARIGKYYNKNNEIFARLIEQLASEEGGAKIGSFSELADGSNFYHEAPAYWSKDVFAELKPLVKAGLENKVRLAREKAGTSPESFGGVYEISEKPIFAKKIGFEKLNISLEKAKAELYKMFDPEDVILIGREYGRPVDHNRSLVWGEGYLGTYHDGVIKAVMHNGKVSDLVLYHESFHHYINTYHPLLDAGNMVARAYKENKAYIDKRYSAYGEDTSVKGEEYLADWFADYVAGRHNFVGRIRLFFDSIIRRIKRWLDIIDNNDRIKDLFDIIASGEAKNMPARNISARSRTIFAKKTQPTPGELSNKQLQLLEEVNEEVRSISTKVKVPEEISSSILFWNDKPAITLSRETMERNIDDVSGEYAPAVKEFLTEPIKRNETSRAVFVSALRTQVEDYIVKELGIKKGSALSGLVQQFGEGDIDQKELMTKTDKWQEVIQASKYLRRVYDNMLDLWNKNREQYGYTPVPKRPDYFRHGDFITSISKQIGMVLSENDLPTNISGLTGIFNPGTPFSTAALKRMGVKTTFDAVGGMDEYIDAVSRSIFHTDSVQRGRALEKVIRKGYEIVERANENAEEKLPSMTLPNFVSNLNEYTNLISGKKSQFDRAFESLFGRKIYSVFEFLTKRTSANMIAGNISSALTNFIPVTQLLSTSNKVAVVKGLAEVSKGISDVREIDGQTSGFLARRFMKTEIGMNAWGKTKAGLNYMFKLVDMFTSRWVVSSKYYENLSNGMSRADALREADNYAARVVTDRSIGQLPNLFGIKTLRAVTQFQAEINNQWSFLTKDMPLMSKGNKLKLLSMLIQFFLYSYLFNELYERIVGRRPAIDPIYDAMTLAGTTVEGRNKGLMGRTGVVIEDLSGNLPFTASITGGRLPISSGLPSIGKALSGESDWVKEIKKPFFFLVFPVGGNQLKKSIEGVTAYKEGASYSKAGLLQYPIDQTPENAFKTAIFGKSSTGDSAIYYGEGRSVLGKKQTAEYKRLLQNNPSKARAYYDKVIDKREKKRDK